jgi:protein-tyrosine phosphatase
METQTRWIELDGAVNVRDLGGLATTDGRTTRYGRVLRADNLQDLTPADIANLTGTRNLRDVIDLRSDPEVRLEGPGPLTRASGVTIHHLSLFLEANHTTDIDLDKVLPWQSRQQSESAQERSVGHYLGYLHERADSIIAALRVIAYGSGAAIVHCAAGKDRTGVVCALALETAGATRDAVIADYAQTGERLDAVLGRLRSSDTYAADLDSRPNDSHHPHAAIMDTFLATIDEEHGGALPWLSRHGWNTQDTTALRLRLVGLPS